MTTMLLRFTDDEPWDARGIIRAGSALKPVYVTPFGQLFEGDCLHVLPQIADDTIDTVFADPPFNVGKKYGKSTDDERPDGEYVQWCRKWIDECIRTLKPGEIGRASCRERV